ncbi:hypothetical protein HID58_013181 [Brassica napus]|uniref:Uncharacterized protein n=1 Tax=Brassica napus TaxID=3708 RepID=A0ABQ8E2Q7_BRANA|nr:hypothetical protein HID58_013024 [Brassica napus]KAH0936064.1 hypothetical protein HID58_013181 [Brassica napus]
MAINQLHFSDLKDECCKKTIVAQILRFWDARDLKKVGEHLGLDLVFLDKKVSENEQLMALANINVDFPGRLLLNATPGTTSFDNECLDSQSVLAALYGSDDGSSSTASKYGSVKKIERVTLAELNNYVLNSPPQLLSFSKIPQSASESLQQASLPRCIQDIIVQNLTFQLKLSEIHFSSTVSDAVVSSADEASASKKAQRLRRVALQYSNQRG